MARRARKPKARCKGVRVDLLTLDPDVYGCQECARPVRVKNDGQSYSHYPLKDVTKSDTRHGAYIVKTYGMTGEQYEALLAYQDGACAICLNKPKTKRFAVDHDHSNGNVRGILCRSCNYKLLGGAKDSIDTLQRAIFYLDSPPAYSAFDTYIRKGE